MGKKRSSRKSELSAGQKIQKRLVENITLLWAMCEIPNVPKENKLHASYDERRQLSLEREQQLVDNFAFISASTDNMLRVMAVCIEETPDQNRITIRLASNTGDLSPVIQGFKDIARTLEQASSKSDSRSDIRRELFRQIVILDEPRILSRLRSRHAARSLKTKGRAEFLPLLSKTIHDKSINSRGEMMKTSLTSLQSHSKQLLKQFYKFEAARGSDYTKNASREILIELLIQISEFDVCSLEKALGSTRVIDPSLKASLPLALSKIGRYYHIACDLVDAARSPQYTLFRRISVQAIDKPHLDMVFIADHSAGFEEVFRRVTSSSHQYRHTDFDPQTVSAVRTKFQKRIADSATAWKIHAEVQILLFYKQTPQMIRPRIIGSSKSACYLCNLFIQSHGQFQVSRSHGRLYDRWILPAWPLDQVPANRHLRSAVDKLNGALEAKIISVLNDKQLPFAHPAESVLIFRQPWSPNPTLSNISNRETKAIHETTDSVSVGPSRGPTEPHPTTSSCSFSIPKTSINQEDLATSLSANPMHVQSPPPQPVTTFRHLSQGDSTSCKITQKSDVFAVETDAGTIYTSWDVPSEEDAESKSLPSGRACWIQVTSLAGDAQTNQVHEPFDGVDVHLLTPGHDYIFENGSALSSKELTVQLKGHTLLVKYSFEDPENHQISNTASG